MSRSYYRSLISTAVPLLCDTVAGAYFGVSLRKLRAAYSWSCIRVQRSSDNTQANIGFVNDELDISALLSFVGGSNGTVVTFYDQIGSNNLSGIAPPIIVEAGTLVSQNGKPSLKFTGPNVSGGTAFLAPIGAFNLLHQAGNSGILCVVSFNDPGAGNYNSIGGSFRAVRTEVGFHLSNNFNGSTINTNRTIYHEVRNGSKVV